MPARITQLLIVFFTCFGTALAQHFPVKNVDEFASIMRDQYHIPSKSLDPIITHLRKICDVKTRPQQANKAIKSIKKPAEKNTWDVYRKRFINQQRIDNGIAYQNTHAKILQVAKEKYHAAPSIITAITGVETNYGKNQGSYSALNALGSLAFVYPKRQPFFQKELAKFIVLTNKYKINPFKVKSSYAGALGIPQFMPSSYLHFSVNEQGQKKGVINLFNNHNDSIMSIANYLHQHQWRQREFIARPIHLTQPQIDQLKIKKINKKRIVYHNASWYKKYAGIKITSARKDEQFGIAYLDTVNPQQRYWLVTKNFDAIMSYNPRVNYAMAVFHLYQDLRKHKKSNT